MGRALYIVSGSFLDATVHPLPGLLPYKHLPHRIPCLYARFVVFACGITIDVLRHRSDRVDVFEKNCRAVQRVQGILFMRKNASHPNSIFEVDGIGRRLHISAATAATTTAPAITAAITIMLTHFECFRRVSSGSS